MVAFKNSTGIKANSSFCTFRFPIAEAHQLTKPFQYQAITTALPTQPFAHFVFMPILHYEKLKHVGNLSSLRLANGHIERLLFSEHDDGIEVVLIEIDDTHYGNKK